MRIGLIGYDEDCNGANGRTFASVISAFGEIVSIVISKSSGDIGAAEREVAHCDISVFWEADDVAARMLALLGGQRLVLASARGCEAGIEPDWYVRFQACQFISLSRSRHEMLLTAGLDSAYFQYYPSDAGVVLDPAAMPAPKLVSGAFSPDDIADLARGAVLMVPEGSVMSEYVGHLASGILYDPAGAPHLPSLDFETLARLSRGASARAARGLARWHMDIDRLGSLIVGDERRWAATDGSAAFATQLRKRAHTAAQAGAGFDMADGV